MSLLKLWKITGKSNCMTSLGVIFDAGTQGTDIFFFLKPKKVKDEADRNGSMIFFSSLQVYVILEPIGNG